MKLEVFSRRWGNCDSYDVKITQEGWRIDHIAIGGECDPAGRPHLFGNLKHDSINYPAQLDVYMERLWEKAKEEDMNDQEIQVHLDELGEWIQLCEKNSPGGF